MGWLLSMVPGTLVAADLRGTVTDESGQPIPEARVLISTAQVREGFSPLCPSCYSDCGKAATTDSDGHFTIANIDDALLFNVLIAARS
ncbi:carboxypeptidase regulatory-like domain-containing protein [Terrimicrobium sacchariphilum]|uniref:Carboxypeptidase regulatory-like domain-containing protein n=2 Tax=Terrimicrobium sacchariphilum TaxID=690879 RepID=A0A146GD38_TERSA|nr:carboxypeptidase regulatory-like domain-containing protein [Terrimicrobium sacchariphilum]